MGIEDSNKEYFICKECGLKIEKEYMSKESNVCGICHEHKEAHAVYDEDLL